MACTRFCKKPKPTVLFKISGAVTLGIMALGMTTLGIKRLSIIM